VYLPQGTSLSRNTERTPIMLCYPCAEQGTDKPAVALCRSCNAGLCLDHVRVTAAHLASSHILDTCQRDTWIVTEPPPGAGDHPDARSRAISGPGPAERLLFVADAAVADVGELPPVARALTDTAAEVYVLTPTLPGRLAWLTDDVDRCRHVADERLDTVLRHMHSIGAHASGLAARGSVMTVIADAVEDFKPDHILLGLRNSEHANWQEHRLGEHVKKRFGLPLTTYAIDPGGHGHALSLKS
jgi:Uncharacterized protein conserved in archaea (DUF2180)